MKKVLLILLISLFLNCADQVIKKEEKINNIKLNLVINDNEKPIYHIYFKNIDNNKKSCGLNLVDKTNQTSLEVFPGTYKIYILSLIDKTSTTKCIDKFTCSLLLCSKIRT